MWWVCFFAVKYPFKQQKLFSTLILEIIFEQQMGILEQFWKDF